MSEFFSPKDWRCSHGFLRGEQCETCAKIKSLEAEIERLTAERDAALVDAWREFARAIEAKCKCEHWQSCVECHPTAHAALARLAKRSKECGEQAAKLAALEAQEPIGWMDSEGTTIWTTRDISNFSSSARTEYPIPLYAAAGAAPVPESYQLVPVEPTPEMCNQGAQAIVSWENGATWPDSWGVLKANRHRKDCRKAYVAMLAAAKGP